MRTLVTGGGGFLGGAIVRQLVAAGHTVRTVARGEYPALTALGVPHLRGDLTDPAVAFEAVEGVDVVFHVAAKTGVWGPRQAFEDSNVGATGNLLTAMQATSVRHLVYTSSPSVVFDGRDHLDADASLPYPTAYLAHYPATKAKAEQLVLAANRPDLAVVALRPHLIWGPGDPWLLPRVIARAKAGRLRIVGTGHNRVSITYVDNAAAAHLQAATALMHHGDNAGKAYFVNDPAPVALWRWINGLLERVGAPPVHKKVSYEFAHTLGGAAELVWSVFGLAGEPPMTRFVAAQLARSHTYSIADAQRDFAYSPTVGPEAGLDRTVSWFRGR